MSEKKKNKIRECAEAYFYVLLPVFSIISVVYYFTEDGTLLGSLAIAFLAPFAMVAIIPLCFFFVWIFCLVVSFIDNVISGKHTK